MHPGHARDILYPQITQITPIFRPGSSLEICEICVICGEYLSPFLYDLLWYLSDPDWPSPNLTLLNNALRQTGWRRRLLSEGTWREVVRKRLATIAWGQAVADARPFLEPSAALKSKFLSPHPSATLASLPPAAAPAPKTWLG